jgi:beta-alanine degradation protein BauB
MSEVSERVGTSVLFENDRVRVWQDGAGPGETKPLHVHRRPYITVVIAGDEADNLGEDGTLQRRFEGLTPGQAHYVGSNDLPIVHALRNTGSTEIAILIIELLT